MDGVHYHFMTVERYRELVGQNAFIEHAEVHGNLYGTLKSELMPAIEGNDRRLKNPTVQVYFDTERQEFRCFKVANVLPL